MAGMIQSPPVAGDQFAKIVPGMQTLLRQWFLTIPAATI
jgi:hypothetical protein